MLRRLRTRLQHWLQVYVVLASVMNIRSHLWLPTYTSQANCWLSGSKDGDARRYEIMKPVPDAKPTIEGLVASAQGVPIRSIAVDPKSARVAVTSE